MNIGACISSLPCRNQQSPPSTQNAWVVFGPPGLQMCRIRTPSSRQLVQRLSHRTSATCEIGMTGSDVHLGSSKLSVRFTGEHEPWSGAELRGHRNYGACGSRGQKSSSPDGTWHGRLGTARRAAVCRRTHVRIHRYDNRATRANRARGGITAEYEADNTQQHGPG